MPKSATAPPSNISDEDLPLNTREAAKLILGPTANKTTLEHWRVKGIGPRWFKVDSGSVRYRRVDIDSYIAANLRQSTSDPGPSDPE